MPSQLKEIIDSHKFSLLEVMEDCTEETDDEHKDFVAKLLEAVSVMDPGPCITSLAGACVAFMWMLS